jgi:hypothetical protein
MAATRMLLMMKEPTVLEVLADPTSALAYDFIYGEFSRVGNTYIGTTAYGDVEFEREDIKGVFIPNVTMLVTALASPPAHWGVIN